MGWQHTAARLARRVVVIDVRAGLPAYNAPAIPGEIPRRRKPGAGGGAGRAPTERGRGGGATVASLIPLDATLEVGLGPICDVASAALDVGVRMHSGLVTDTLVDLERRGLLLATAEAAYAWGSDDLAALSAGGRLRLVPIDLTHDSDRLAGFDQFTAVNSALKIGLDGSVNVEVSGGRPVSGIGGHADFCRAAARSAGGLSIVALTATRRGCPTIVPAVEKVSTPGTDVDIVVTEHGIADLRNAHAAERRRRLIAIAAPEFRESLNSAGVRQHARGGFVGLRPRRTDPVRVCPTGVPEEWAFFNNAGPASSPWVNDPVVRLQSRASS